MKRITLALLVLCTVVTFCFSDIIVMANSKVVFDDVTESHWAYNQIAEMNKRGIITGYPDGHFYPDKTITRAEFAKIMCLAADLYVSEADSSSFEDVEITDWFAPYVECGKKYLSGYKYPNGMFYKPDENAVREDIAVALVKLMGYSANGADESVLAVKFKDSETISTGARKYIAVAVEKGLINGYSDDTFRPKNNLTRAEAATLLYKVNGQMTAEKVFDLEETETMDKTDEEIATEPDEDYTKEVESEYEYSVDTIVENAEDFYCMLGTSDGVMYSYRTMISPAYPDGTGPQYSGISVALIEKNGKKVKKLLSADEIPYLGDEKLTKQEKAELRTQIIAMGYEPETDYKYCIISQMGTGYLYNMDTDEAVDITGALTDRNHRGLQIENNVFYLWNGYIHSGDWLINIEADTYQNSAFADQRNAACGVAFGNMYCFWGSNIKEYNNRNGNFEVLDFYIKGMDGVWGSNDDYIYALSENDNKVQAFYGIDENGDSEKLFDANDIDNVDGKTVKFSTWPAYSTAVSANGDFYFYDSNYKCIRMIYEN